jgi:hypothetical protein
MRRRALLSLIASCALSACAHQTVPEAMPGMAWSLNQVEGEGLKLAFGAPNSDNVLLMLQCRPRSGEVVVWLTGADANGRAPVLIRSGPTAARVAARQEAQPEGELIEARLAASDPILQSFARTGELAVEANGRRTALPAADPAQSRRFVESCRPA